MEIRKAVITAAGKNQRTLPLQTLVDRDGVPKTALGILIEEVLDQHDSVGASAVIGMKSETRGELPLAFVEIKEGHDFDEQALRSFVRERIVAFKVPKEIRQIDQLPRNPTGKIMRRQLQA